MTLVLPAMDGRWDTSLAGIPHDVFHTAGFHRFSSASDGGEPYLVVVGNGRRGLAWPYVLRDLDRVEGLPVTGARDIGSLHGYTGPIAWGVRPGDPWLAEAWQAVRSTWIGHGAVSAFVRFHPLFAGADLAAGLGALQPGAVVAECPTVSVDCALDDRTAVAGYTRATRQEIAQARRAGLVTTPDAEWACLGTFMRLYEATLARNGASPSSGLRLADILRLRAELDRSVHLLVTRVERRVVAAGVFTEYRGTIEALVVGTDDEFRRWSPLKLLLDDVRRWGHERGDSVLHLGGGRGGRQDSLFAFKSRFSERRHLFSTGRWILDGPAYRELVAVRTRRLAAAGRSVSGTGWFPAYRSPLLPTTPVAVPVVRWSGTQMPTTIAVQGGTSVGDLLPMRRR